MQAEPPRKIGDRTVREVFQQSVRKVVQSRALKSAYGIGEQKALKLRAIQDAAARPLASPIAVKCALKAEGMETPDIDLSAPGVHEVAGMTVEVIDPVVDYAALMENLFDFDAIRDLFA